ncbi:MAG TPA: phage holin family protein [Acidimicrobiia bacterium]|nr:phage holin family protein [Acidimicrobiia bacterium]
MERHIDVRDDTSLGELFSRLTADLSKLMRDEVELAKVEINETVTNARTAGVSFGAAGVLGLMGFLMLSFAAAWGLAEVVHTGVAFLVVGGAYALVALALLALGRQRIKAAKPVPEQTVETLKEDVAWAKQQMS